MQSLQDQVWVKMWKENSAELREKAVIWRKQNALTRIERPSRISRARRLGYKAKQGIIVVRMRVGAGGMRKQRPTGGRRPKHLGVVRIKAAVSMKQVAERRVLEKYPNMKLFGSYFLYKDSKYYWEFTIVVRKVGVVALTVFGTVLRVALQAQLGSLIIIIAICLVFRKIS